MKKTYINPTTETVNVEMAQMIAISGFDDTLNGEGTTGDKALSLDDDFDLWNVIK